jgi:hypothetical protein
MKQTKAVIRQRVEEMLAVRLDGAMFHQIRQYAAEKGWNVSDRQLYRYIDASDALLEKTLEKNREKLIALHLAKRKNLFARCVNAGQFNVALACVRDEAELQDLYPTKGIKVTGQDSGPVVMEFNFVEKSAEVMPSSATAN